MSKLTNKEIEQIKGLEMENGLENGLEIPRDAHSVFQFDINETIKDLKNDLERRNYRDFEVYKIDANRYNISYLRASGVSSELTVGKGRMSIETALGFKYNITEKPEGGSRVTFEGPVNALLDQDLLPKMTYVPYTLSAKFIDSENGKDLTDYMNMNSYGFLRAEKNKKADEWGDKENPQDQYQDQDQDRYGYHINAKFNNEIDFLPLSNKVDEKENSVEEKWEGNSFIPAGAHSVFQFDVNETLESLKCNLKRKKYGYSHLVGPQYKHDDCFPDDYYFVSNLISSEDFFRDPNRYDIKGRVDVYKDKIEIGLAEPWYGSFTITENHKGGCNVTFEGAVGNLGTDLFPEMTYVPHTLRAKFVDDGKDLTPYVNMHLFGALRADQLRGGSCKKNDYSDDVRLDEYGDRVNARFNNEIDFLPLSNKVDEKENSVVKQNKENLVVEQNVETALYKVRDMISHKSAEALKNISEPAQKATNVVRKNTKDLER